MEDPNRWKEVFQSVECRELCEEDLIATNCANHLRMRLVISSPDLEAVESCITSKVACVKLLDFLVMREDSWRELLDYLKGNNQKSVVSKLQKLYENKKLVKDNRIIYYQTEEGKYIPKQWNVPPRNPHFTGRDQLLEQLASSLKPSDANAIMFSVCQGLGGVGKTQSAIEFAHRHKTDYPYVFWIMAAEPGQIEADYSRLARLINIDTQKPLDVVVKEVKAWLNRHAGGLLVYDGAPNLQALKDHLPTNNTSIILATSRTTHWEQLGKSFTVEVFTAKEARESFQKLLGNLFDMRKVDLLAATLGCLPLAIAQAGAYMKKNKVAPSRYLEMYEKDKMRLLANKVLPRDYTAPLFTTWDNTLQEIRKRSHLAPALLALCSCLHGKDIPYCLLNEWANSETNNPNQEVLEEALRIVLEYSMLTINQEGESVSIHCIVQEVIRLKWTEEVRRQTLQIAVELTRNSFPYEHKTGEDFTKTKRMLPHSEVLLTYLQDWSSLFEESDFNLSLLKILSTLAQAYLIYRNDQKRFEVLDQMLAIQVIHYGSDHSEVAITMANLGNAYGSFGQYEKKQELLERALPIYEKHYGPDHPEVAIILASLGTVYGDLGQYAKQREQLERALTILERHYGPSHLEVATTLVILGYAYGSLGQNDKHREQLERALPVLEKRFGPDHLEVAITLTNLGNAYGDLGQYDKKRELLERSLPILERHYGPDHPEVARTLTDLGNAYGLLGQYNKERELLERVLIIKVMHYGPDHPEVAITLTDLGDAYGDLGQYDKKQELLEQALQIQEQYYGPDHPSVAITLTDLGNAYGLFGQYDKRRELLERALPIQEQRYGPDHLEVAITLTDLGNAYGNLGQYNKKQELLERVLTIKEKHYGPDHFEVAITLTDLGDAYGDLGQYNKKQELLERVLRINEMQ